MTRRPTSDPRTERVTFRLTPAERDTIRGIQTAEGLPDEAETVRFLLDLGRGAYATRSAAPAEVVQSGP